jgi:taurine--2-oxoglutarate transaminase
VGDVRGLGVFWGLDLVKNRDTREPALPYAAPLSFNGGDNAVAKAFAEAKKRGLLLFPAGNRLHVVPPCNVSAAEVDAAMAILDEALTVADQYAN